MAASMLLCEGCQQRTQTKPAPTPEVTVVRAMELPVADFVEFTGRVAPSRTATLVARVTGYLESVNFADGAWVEDGQLLFVIEPASYRAHLESSRAQLTQAEAEYARQQELLEENATSAASVEKWRSQRDQAAAQVELARINLGYTRVTAPFAGRVGQRLVDPGNLVGPGGITKLAMIDQLTPIYVNFTVNEKEALRVRRLLKSRGVSTVVAGTDGVRVQVRLSDEDTFPHEGVLAFVDGRLSESTGSLAVRAVLANKDRALFPGLFARIRIPLGRAVPMPVVPEAALGHDLTGDFVWVAGPDQRAIRRQVEKGVLTPGGRALRRGIEPGEDVIVRGLQRVRAGERVKPVALDRP
jgi:RND family efflux transporter MFP subunit